MGLEEVRDEAEITKEQPTPRVKKRAARHTHADP